MENILEEISKYFKGLTDALVKTTLGIIELFVHVMPLLFIGGILYLISNLFR
jgi:hypothetical protein